VLDIGFFDEDLTGLEAQTLDLFLGDGFTALELLYLPGGMSLRG
jgi:hypothetical protein